MSEVDVSLLPIGGRGDQFEAVDNRLDLDRLEASMPDRSREIVALMREGLSQAEISRKLGVSESRVSQLMERGFDGARRELARPPARYIQVSGSERRVIEQLMTGKQNGEIADKLCISEKTVKYHLTNVFAKAHVKSRGELIAKLIKGEIKMGLDAQFDENEIEGEEVEIEEVDEDGSEDELLSIADAAMKAEVGLQTIMMWVASGKCPSEEHGSGKRIRMSVIEKIRELRELHGRDWALFAPWYKGSPPALRAQVRSAPVAAAPDVRRDPAVREVNLSPFLALARQFEAQENHQASNQILWTVCRALGVVKDDQQHPEVES